MDVRNGIWDASAMDELRRLIREAVEAKKTTYKDLSIAIAKNHAYIQQFVERETPRELRERDARTIVDLIQGAPAAGEAPPRRAPGFAPQIVPGEQLVGHRDLPIFAAAQGGDGHVIVTFDAVEYVKRPSVLEGVRGAYGIYLTGSSMIPAYEPGDMALVHPHLPPARDKDVVLYHVPPANDAEAIIKRLVSFNDREWTLRQYNPFLEFTESRVEWSFCHRVVGKYSAR
ncbi:S24 family peptidase [Ensifer sp. B1-9]|uniref:S24 family peptidase n=1 Tax=Ensifer sp. B1-9 TaxID=3141455 RepID=UPI003D21F466